MLICSRKTPHVILGNMGRMGEEPEVKCSYTQETKEVDLSIDFHKHSFLSDVCMSMKYFSSQLSQEQSKMRTMVKLVLSYRADFMFGPVRKCRALRDLIFYEEEGLYPSVFSYPPHLKQFLSDFKKLFSLVCFCWRRTPKDFGKDG